MTKSFFAPTKKYARKARERRETTEIKSSFAYSSFVLGVKRVI